ncbi:Protein of unknown function [Pyronema omphalodes CBS 100304]|uniref:Uncharacterized protein n=1 Tax=Pyronema omphalodes (strain CBS 100304) TaxID=1076935 RepID=U4L2X2_PYROM|nr:Protein of unknown function [Pyronema omphalodes CBS 100304]
MFRTVPTAIKDHFTKNILRRDIKSGLLQNYKNIKNVNQDVLQAAYKEAFDAANETAFRVACENVLKAAQEYRSKRTKHETDQDRKKLLEELGIALTEALQKTRSASFTAAYRAAHSAAVRSESESTDGQNSPSNLNTLDTDTAPRILLPDSLKGATELGINQLGLKEPTDSTIDLITMLSTSPQTEVLEGIIEESTSETVRPQSTGLDTDPVSLKVPAVQCKQKQSISSSLSAAFRSACAASRAASRHAVRLAALDAALGPSGAADASEAAIWRFTGDFYGNHFIEDFQESDFAEIVSEAKKTTKKTFRQHFDRAAADVDTNIGVTADIVERSTATGIFIAAQKAIETAKKTLPHGAHDFSMMSSMIAMTTSGIAASCMMSMDETVASQQPVKSTESSKGPQVTVSKKYSDQTKACEDAENILLSKAFQNIELARNPSISTRLLSSLKTAGTVVQDQLMDVPGLFTPSKHQSRRIRKPRSTDGKRAFGSA